MSMKPTGSDWLPFAVAMAFIAVASCWCWHLSSSEVHVPVAEVTEVSTTSNSAHARTPSTSFEGTSHRTHTDKCARNSTYGFALITTIITDVLLFIAVFWPALLSGMETVQN